MADQESPQQNRSPHQRNPLESAASDLAESIRAGRRAEPESSTEQGVESQLRDLMPVIERLENARKTHLQRPGGLASLGASRPEQLGDYHIVRQIGRGGMGVVFEAVQKSLGRRVALKVLPKTLLSDDEQLQRFQHEAKTAASLHHTNIVPVFGVGQDQGFHYFVMQRIDGRGLDRAQEEHHFSPADVARLGVQAASALAYAHQQQILHRDIKPANLIVNDENQLWVTDFGVAKAIETDPVTRTGDVVGTLRYMAPEQVAGHTDVRSDVYSLGVTLYELLAGRPALDDESVRAALVARRPVPKPKPLRQLNPKVSRDLDTILQTAMAIDANERYDSAEQFGSDLQRFLDGQPISVRRLTIQERAGRWAKQNPAVASLSAFSLLLLIGIAVVSSAGYVRVQGALQREQTTRTEVEETAKLATSALDDIFERFSDVSSDAVETPQQFTSEAVLSREVAELLEQLLQYYDALVQRSESDSELKESAANARYAMGHIHFRLGHYERAIEAFEHCLNHSSDNQPHTTALLHAQIHNWIGHSFQMLGKRADAEKQHERSLTLLNNAGVSNEVKFEMARTHFLLAARLRPGMGPTSLPPTIAVIPSGERIPFDRPRGGPFGRPFRRPGSPFKFYLHHLQPLEKPGSAEEAHLQKAVATLRKLRKRDANHVGYSLALAASLRQLAGDSISKRTTNEDEYEREAIALLRDLLQKYPDNALVRSELAATLAQVYVFDFNLSLVTMERLIDRLTEAAHHCEALAIANPNVPDYTNRMVHTHFKLAVMLDQLGQEVPEIGWEMQREAGISFDIAVRYYEAMVQRHPNAPGYQAWYAVFLQRQGENLMQSGMQEQAERSLTDSIETWLAFSKEFPDETIALRALPHVYRMLSHAQRRLDKEDAADQSMMEAEIYSILDDLDD